MIKKIKYKDPFIGEIELTHVGETSRHAVGESIIDSIYTDLQGNYYIDTWCSTGYLGEIPMKILRKELIDKIIEIGLKSVGD